MSPQMYPISSSSSWLACNRCRNFWFICGQTKQEGKYKQVITTPTLARQQLNQDKGQPHKPLPEFSNKYCWKHGKCSHEGAGYNNKPPKHQDAEIFSNKRGGSTYGFTWKGGLTSLMMLKIYHKINILQQANKIVVDPPPHIIVKADTRATAHYFTNLMTMH